MIPMATFSRPRHWQSDKYEIEKGEQKITTCTRYSTPTECIKRVHSLVSSALCSRFQQSILEIHYPEYGCDLLINKRDTRRQCMVVVS